MIATSEIEHFFHTKIPLTAAIGVRVETWDTRQLILTAPLAANHNHLGTAFGGSLAALLILSGYGLLWLELGDSESHIVVRKTALDYRRPVHDPLRAICLRPPPDELANFKETYARRGKARIELHATVEQAGEVAVDFRGLSLRCAISPKTRSRDRVRVGDGWRNDRGESDKGAGAVSMIITPSRSVCLYMETNSTTPFSMIAATLALPTSRQ